VENERRGFWDIIDALDKLNETSNVDARVTRKSRLRRNDCCGLATVNRFRRSWCDGWQWSTFWWGLLRYRAGSLVDFQTCSPVMDPAIKDLEIQGLLDMCASLRKRKERWKNGAVSVALSVRAADSVSCSLWCPMTCPGNLLYRPVLYCLVLTTALERYVWKRDKWRTPIDRQAYLGMNGARPKHNSLDQLSMHMLNSLWHQHTK
jgi:hypothetical protein